MSLKSNRNKDWNEILIRSALALLVILLLPFVIAVLSSFQVAFNGTVTTTADLFSSVNSGNIINDLFFIYALKTAIELFGYQSILHGISWYFVIIVVSFFAAWFIGGFITRSHRTNIVIWVTGIAYVFIVTWIASTSIPPGNIPAADAFAALNTLVFSIDVWFSLVMYALVGLGGAALGTRLGQRRRKKPRSECTPTDFMLGKCDEFSLA